MSLRSVRHWRTILFESHSLALLSGIGILTGVATALVISGFMLCIDQVIHLLQGQAESGFHDFSPIIRFTLPFAGAALLILVYKLSNKRYQDVGIAHVIDRLQRGRGKVPVPNAVFQFVSAVITLASGFSMGKEGPAVHVGSSIASKLGQQLYRSPSQLRLLTGCGTAAAISAAFGTPLAGVLFAMEIVLMEYSLNGFIPIIAASVTASVMTKFILGESAALLQTEVSIGGLIDMPWVILTGIVTGLVAAGLHKTIKTFLMMNLVRVEVRFFLAAMITGLLGYFRPEVMGLGYDTMNQVLAGQFSLGLLITLLLAKMLATGAAVGLGIPAGIVAPSLVIGLTTGAIIGVLAPGDANNAYYALIGMAGLMSALLHAPLAALTAILELSLNAQMMFPAMMVVVLANLTCQVLFSQPSVFRTLLSVRGLNITTHPMRNALASRFLTEIATFQFCVLTDQMDEAMIAHVIETDRRLVVFRYQSNNYLMTMNMVQKQFERWHSLENKSDVELIHYIAKAIPERSRIALLEQDVSLLEGIRILQNDNVVAIQVPVDKFRIGLVTRAKLTSVLTTEGELQ
jgi:chloride channel protein, CIC family